MSDAKPEPVDQLAKTLPSEVFKPGALRILVGVGVGIFLGGCGYAYAQTVKSDAKAEARAAVDAGAQQISADVRTLRADFEANKKDVGDALRRLSDDNHETQLDVRELYRVIRTGRSSERLEAPPVTDGGR